MVGLPEALRDWSPGDGVPTSSDVDGHGLAGHGSASSSICLLA